MFTHLRILGYVHRYGINMTDLGSLKECNSGTYTLPIDARAVYFPQFSNKAYCKSEFWFGWAFSALNDMVFPTKPIETTLNYN